jgi:hypothetical protein
LKNAHVTAIFKKGDTAQNHWLAVSEK